MSPAEITELCRAPFRLQPIPVRRVWGGERILTDLHPGLEAEPPIGESWDVSDVDDDPAFHSTIVWDRPVVDGVPRTLRELLTIAPLPTLGSAIAPPAGVAPRLPLLYKLIDAREALSVQVHPADELVEELGLDGAGKTEAWIILEAEPGAHIVYGLEPGLSYSDYLERAREGRGDEGLAKVPVERGDIAYLPSGTLHAIGAGIVLAEIQQSSDTTYRIHDWGRLGLDGKPRQLHLAEAAKVVPIDPPPCPLPLPENSTDPRVVCRIDGGPFRLTELRPAGDRVELESRPDRFAILSVLEGQAKVTAGPAVSTLGAGEVLFFPAAARAHPVSIGGEFWGLWMEPNPEN